MICMFIQLKDGLVWDRINSKGTYKVVGESSRAEVERWQPEIVMQSTNIPSFIYSTNIHLRLPCAKRCSRCLHAAVNQPE